MVVKDLDSGLIGSDVSSFIVPELNPLVISLGGSFQTFIFSRAFTLYATPLDRKDILLSKVLIICQTNGCVFSFQFFGIN